MASTKEIAVNLVNYEKQNAMNAINQKSRNRRLFTWKTVFICVINGKCDCGYRHLIQSFCAIQFYITY